MLIIKINFGYIKVTENKNLFKLKINLTWKMKLGYKTFTVRMK